MTIEVTAWAPDQQTAQNFMVDISIATIVDGVFQPTVEGNIDEIGEIIKVAATIDEQGNVVTPATIVKGHHVNVRFVGKAAEILTEGLDQVDEYGNLLPLFERTRILELVSQRTGEQMVWTSLTEDGLPSGYQNSDGIRLFDPSSINTRARIWQ